MIIAMERVLAWKLMPRLIMTLMYYSYLYVLNCFMTLLTKAMTYQPTALTAPMTGAMANGGFAVWLGHAK